jgi:hypothetical protein
MNQEEIISKVMANFNEDEKKLALLSAQMTLIVIEEEIGNDLSDLRIKLNNDALEMKIIRQLIIDGSSIREQIKAINRVQERLEFCKSKDIQLTLF